MAIYKEQPSKLNHVLSDSDNPVKIKIDCFYGTVASVSFYHNGLKSINCGETTVIGKASELKGVTIEFNGAANNPDGQAVKVSHTIFEENGNTTTYTFPNDYTGTPEFDPNDENPDYKFFVNFR